MAHPESRVVTPDGLREAIREHLDAQGVPVLHIAAQTENPNGTTGIHRNAAYRALNATGEGRISTVRRIAEAAGFEVEPVFRIRLRQPKRDALHL